MILPYSVISGKKRGLSPPLPPEKRMGTYESMIGFYSRPK